MSLSTWLAVSAGFAFVLSLTIGLLSGVNFFAALFRAVMGGAVFSGLVYGISVVVKKYLPELLSAAESRGGEGRGDSSEGTVDIILDDTPEFAGVQADAGTEELEGESTETESSEDVSSVRLTEEASGPDFGDEFVEEIQRPRETVTGSSGAAMSDISEGLELEDVDELPDLESFDGSFGSSALGAGAQETDEGGDYSESPRSSRGRGSIDVMGEEHDTESIAKAVRTILKKDREG